MLGVLQFGLNIEILIRQICHINYATGIDLLFQIYLKDIENQKNQLLFAIFYFLC